MTDRDITPEPENRGPLAVRWLGRMAYADALALQEETVALRRAGEGHDVLLLVEHPAVVTLGRSTRPENLLVDPAGLAARGIERFEAKRGGDVTYHAPGQLVGYPILDLERRRAPDVVAYLRAMEAALVDVLEAFGVPAARVAGRTGVFIDLARSKRPDGPPRKIASIGIGMRRWVTYHGFALNVDVDLEGFGVIVPCGLEDVEMTSVAAELGLLPGETGDLFDRVRAATCREFLRHFGPVAEAAIP